MNLPNSAYYLSRLQYFQSASSSDFKAWQRSSYLDLRWMFAFGMSRLLSKGYYLLWQYELKKE